MELSPDTTLYINLWTIIAVIVFLWKMSASITKFKEHTETKIQDHDERLRELENLDLKRILTEMQINLQRIMKKMEDMEKKIK